MFRRVKTLRIGAFACVALVAAGAGVAVSQAQQRQTPLFYDARRLPDMEVERRNQEVAQEQRRAAEERRLETEANTRRLADEAKAQEARIAAEAAAKKKADDLRLAAADADAKKKADDDKRIAAEAEAKRKADEAVRIAALDSQRRAEEEKRIAAEAEAKKKAEEAARVAALEAQRRSDEEKRLAAAADAKKKAEEAARVAALEAQRKADEEKRLAAEADTKKKADEARVAALEAQRKADDEKKRLVAEADAKQKADEAARVAALAAQSRTAQQTAALIPQVVAPPAAPAGAGANCEPTKAQVSYPGGGVMRAAIASPCRKGQAVTVTYGGYESVSVVSANGQATIDVDLFLGNMQPVKLAYAGGHTEMLQPAARDLGSVSKVALIWQAPVDLDLHALENGVNPSEAGDVWAGSTLSGADAKAKLADGLGRGFVSRSDDGTQGGTKIEVYTFFHSPEQPNGVVTMVLDYVTRGNNPAGEFCGTGAKASIPYEVVTLSPKGQSSRERGIVAPAACGTKFTAASRLIRDAVPDLQF